MSLDGGWNLCMLEKCLRHDRAHVSVVVSRKWGFPKVGYAQLKDL